MKISGRKIAEEIKEGLQREIGELSKKGVTPKIAIITLGPESSWESYVIQKLKVAAELGIKTDHINLSDEEESLLFQIIERVNNDPSINGLIVQRPFPPSVDKMKVTGAIAHQKDVDGFRENSSYKVPVWLAVKLLVEKSLEELAIKKPMSQLNFAVLGKGETAGMPTIQGLRKIGIEPEIIDSKTQNRTEILKEADVVISCVGKSRVVRASELKPGVVLIGVGTHGEDLPAGRQVEKRRVLKGDYDEEEIKKIAGAYTPTPGGVGPVNLSFLFNNLLKAAKSSLDKEGGF